MTKQNTSFRQDRLTLQRLKILDQKIFKHIMERDELLKKRVKLIVLIENTAEYIEYKKELQEWLNT